METIHVVTLEILRRGPSHNQLLSPLTNYLALCGNHPAVSLQIPFEHNQLKLRLRQLTYKDSAATMEMQIDDISQSLAGILGLIPGLIADTVNSPGADQPLIHLRLILSASELAMLPFEIARAPSGLPGAGQPLLLQSSLPVCLTREVRRVKKDKLEWPGSAPRILFIAAQPEDAGPIPLESHLLVLRKAIEPWMRYYNPADRDEYARELGRRMILLPQANIDQIAEACQRHRFTHVHILAHGAQFVRGEMAHFGIALHDPRNPARKSVIDGEKLANVLRANSCDAEDATPAVVTLATCDSGNVGSVEGIGASVAHALHEAGIPLVIASQFPLSFDGSVLIAQLLYDDLLWGADPRPLLCTMRRQLHSRVGQGHDWASLVAYASLPEDLDAQLRSARLAIARQAINAAMNHADFVIENRAKELWQKATDKIEQAKKRVEAAAKRGAHPAEAEGLLASTEKRQAQILHRYDSTQKEKIIGHLKKARDHYKKAYESGSVESWALVQYLVLRAALEGADSIPVELWFTAKTLAQRELIPKEDAQLTWAHGSLMELYLLGSMISKLGEYVRPGESDDLAKRHAREVVNSGVQSEIYTTWQQVRRYSEFFPTLGGGSWPTALVGEILKEFPETPSYF